MHEFAEFLLQKRLLDGSSGMTTEQTIFRFPNDYGASVLRGGWASGGLEVAVLRFDEKSHWGIVHTPEFLPEGVLGYLSEEDLTVVMTTIESQNKSTEKGAP